MNSRFLRSTHLKPTFDDLKQAITMGNVEDLKDLAAHGGDLKGMDNDGNSLLHVAIGKSGLMVHEKTAIIEYLIEKGLDVEQKNKSNITPLYAAAVNCSHPEHIKLLLKAGASPCLHAGDSTPLAVAHDRAARLAGPGGGGRAAQHMAEVRDILQQAYEKKIASHVENKAGKNIPLSPYKAPKL